MKVAVSISQQQNNQELQFLPIISHYLITVVEMRENNQPYSASKNQPPNAPEQSNYTNAPNNYSGYGQQNPYHLNYPYPYYPPQNYHQQPMPHPNYHQYYNPNYPHYHHPHPQQQQQQQQQQQFMNDPNTHPNSQKQGNNSQFQHNGSRFDKNNSGQKPEDPRRRNNDQKQKKSIKPSEYQKQQKKKPTFTDKNLKNNEYEGVENQSYGSDSQKQSESQDEQILYQKSKVILKKRDPVLDSPLEIKKWIEARKRNYPIFGRAKVQSNTIQGEMSILESKIRKKIMLVTSDGRGLMKKLKNMHILKRLIGETQPEMIKTKQNKIKKEKVKLIKENKRKQKIEQQMQQKQKIAANQGKIQMSEQGSDHQSAPLQKPIVKEPVDKTHEQMCKSKIGQEADGSNTKIRGGLTPEDMINHLKQKQKEDKEFFDQLLSYRTNSLNYKYSSQTLQTNFVLEDIFQESSYLLQIIRYIVKNDFFNSN